MFGQPPTSKPHIKTAFHLNKHPQQTEAEKKGRCKSGGGKEREKKKRGRERFRRKTKTTTRKQASSSSSAAAAAAFICHGGGKTQCRELLQT